MAIKINGQDLSKRMFNGVEVSKVMKNWAQVRPDTIPPTPWADCLCFTANTSLSTVRLIKNGNPAVVSLETSTDWTTWNAYTIWDTITLTNAWDKLYWRNTSETDTQFSTSVGVNTSTYIFQMSWSIAASWDVTTLLNKNWTTTLSDYCFTSLFQWCSVLTTPPKLPATTIATYCYYAMFANCSSLTRVPELPATTMETCCYMNMFNGCTSLTTPTALPATTLAAWCYSNMFIRCTSLSALPMLSATTLTAGCYFQMFRYCNNIKLSTTQTWEYQNEYRIPTVWTSTYVWNCVYQMFGETGWTFTWEPSINTTYYTSNTIIS